MTLGKISGTDKASEDQRNNESDGTRKNFEAEAGHPFVSATRQLHNFRRSSSPDGCNPLPRSFTEVHRENIATVHTPSPLLMDSRGATRAARVKSLPGECGTLKSPLPPHDSCIAHLKLTTDDVTCKLIPILLFCVYYWPNICTIEHFVEYCCIFLPHSFIAK